MVMLLRWHSPLSALAGLERACVTGAAEFWTAHGSEVLARSHNGIDQVTTMVRSLWQQPMDSDEQAERMCASLQLCSTALRDQSSFPVLGAAAMSTNMD